MPGQNWILLYILLTAPFSIVLFLYGFFPIVYHADAIASQSDVPDHVGDLSVKKHTLYKPMITKLIIMIIDGLRWDFVAGQIGKVAMPMTNSLLTNSSGCLLQAKLQSPTVTMPRIKAMMTGTMPNFIDIVLNFGSKALNSDSLLLQAQRNGYKLIFYGDDTWLSLFPQIFDRHDGTTSFFVTDFTEVDNNVTRHLQDELNRDDWTVMILHYLGLDHIGHVEGPFGASIKPKLQEMDKIVSQIAQRVQDLNNNGTPVLFVVCGDHGMKDSGGHGGSTPEETTVPFIAIGGTRCSPQEENKTVEIEQLDIAATLSTVLGLPIPSTNLGSTFLDSIYDLDDAKRLFLLYYNSKQIFDRFQKQEQQSQNVSQRYLDAVNLHVAWLNTSEKQSEMVKNIVSSYNAILKEMKDTLITCMIEYGYFGPLGIAIVLLFEICVISFFTQEAVWTMDKRRDFIFLSGLLVCLGFAYISTHFANMNFSFPTNLFNAVLFLLIINIFYINNGLVRSFSFKFKKGPKIHKMFQIGALLHIVSLAGTSFIEEEHQTWYFFWTSTILYFLYYCFTKLFVCHQCNLTSIKMSSGIGLSCSNIRHHVKVCVKLFLLLIGHRVLCKLNSTGDKWAHLPDIAHWLKEDDSKIGMTSLLLFALILLIWIGYKCEDKNYKQFSFFLNVSLAICIYFRHMSNGAVMEIHPLYFSNGIYEVQTFWMITTFSLLSYAYRIILIIRHDKQRFASTILFFIINIWVKISAMLHQPYNVILLPMQIITSSTIDAVLRENNLLDLGILVHYWLGNVFYFYQGNSNSLASIDVAAGYVGLSSYMPFITGAYLIINTYSAIVLAYFLFIYHRQAHQTSGTDIISISKTYIAWRLMTVTVYIFIIHIQRFHLFVWSVFSPKLLYEAMYSVIMCCSVLLVLIVITLQVAMIPNY
ncbi:GPI ethanolamine phosphate transferase 2 isoform X1 [Pogonomyrmex barbatus]|uniref:GPI ethanolamine phosphate transferase 2 isoform X1 n=1 Tax=Pogonomyrmex barbatus TaxID=144034 RepID=A0A6I9WFY3_9HYME|nr:GPI ethanolamine phosphate transferase 2 isoform X1 [Pogonomyrmex barbatus]